MNGCCNDCALKKTKTKTIHVWQLTLQITENCLQHSLWTFQFSMCTLSSWCEELFAFPACWRREACLHQPEHVLSHSGSQLWAPVQPLSRGCLSAVGDDTWAIRRITTPVQCQGRRQEMRNPTPTRPVLAHTQALRPNWPQTNSSKLRSAIPW